MLPRTVLCCPPHTAHRPLLLLAGALLLCTSCRLSSPGRPLDIKTARKLVHEMAVETPWIRIPAGLPAGAARNPRAVLAYRKLAKGGVLHCDGELTRCVIGPNGKDLLNEGTLGLKVSIGFLVADDVSVIRLVDGNTANATVTVRFRPSPVFNDFRPELLAILESQGDAFAGDQIAGGHMATALFHRSGAGWHLENIELLERSGAAVRKIAPAGSEAPVQTVVNLALLASVVVSSEEAASGQSGQKAIDGLIDGNPVESSTEWVARGEREGAWIKLAWRTPVQVWEVVLHDLPNPEDNIRSGTLLFSDGSNMLIGPLPNDGSAFRAEFVPKLVSWLEFKVTSAVGSKTGLAEIEVLGAPPSEASRGTMK